MFARHLKLGRLGEEMAQAYLKQKGYKIFNTNWRSKCGELDIICAQGQILVFVEVKTRKDEQYGLPGQAITPKKQGRLVKAASLYLSQYKLWNRPCRFDLIAVCFENNGCRIEHVRDIIELSGFMGGSHANWQPW